MKQYVIDELRLGDHEKIKAYLDENFSDSVFDDVYWIPVDQSVFGDIQKEHTECQPFYIAIELGTDRISCELLVRTKNKMRCDCIRYATEKQIIWLIQVLDAIFEKLGIRT